MQDFEVKHGNEDTLREMLRIKRSVQATYNTQVNMMASAMMHTSGTGTISDLAPGLTLGLKDDMWRLEAKGMESDVKAGEAAGGGGGAPPAKNQNIMFVRGETQSKAVQESETNVNPDEIDIDSDDDDDDVDGEGEQSVQVVGKLEKMDVPDKVFGGLIKNE